MINNFLKRGAFLLLAVILCLSTVISVGVLNAFADEVSEESKTVVFSFPRDGDENYSAEWGHDELNYMNSWSQKASKRFHVYATGSWEGNICYCIEPGTPIDNDQTVSSNNEDYWKNYPSDYNNTITPVFIRLNIGRILQYGYCGTVTTAWRSQNEEDADKMSHAIATQLLIWETIVGERDEDFNHVDTGSCDAILDTISVNHPLYSKIISYYNNIVKSVQNHSKIPSFFKKSSSSAQSVTLSWNGSKYTTTLTDTNNVLSNYTFTTNNSKVTCSVSGNKLTVSSNTAITSEVTITANKLNGKRKGLVVWGDGIYDTATADIQDLVTFSAEVDDPVVGYMKVKVSSGSAKIVKTSEDGKISGIQFTITGNGVNKTVTTGTNGEITVPNLSAGTYTVTEVVGNIYEPQESRTVTVVAGQTATVTFNNTLKRGDLVVTKTSEDGLNSGVKFRLYGTAANGLSVNEYAVTDSSGKAYFNDVLIGSSYTLEEVDTKAYYITPVPQTVTIEWNKVTNKSVTNTLKRGDLVVTKTSDDNFVKDVTFRLYGTAANGEAVDITAKTDSTGKAYFNDVLIGSNYKLEEVGTKEYYITPVTQTGVNIKWDEVTNKTVHNELKTGDLTVTKTSEDGLISGVKFHLYGTSDSGIKVDEYATTNSNGIAEFKDILIGSNYTLEEVDAKAYYVTPVKQTGVKIEWNKVTNKSFENTLKRGDLKVIKTSEDDMVEGVKFHLVGTSDSGIKVDEHAITDKNGVAVFEDILIGKNYTLSEVDTEFKYITPVSQSTTIEWNKVTEKDFYNELKRGDLTVTKTSEDKLVEGITFRLYGTAECGQYIDIYATTDKSGKAYFKDVLIGSAYILEEVNTADKYITPIPQEVIIEWDKVTEKSVYNELKRGDLTVTKSAEDGLTEGLTFHLYGYSLSGIYVDEYAVTNGNGIAEFKDILIGSNYTLEEYNCPDRYVVPELQEAAIEWNKVTNKSFDNILKKWNAEVYKVDSEYDKPQGDATLEGAVYGVYKNNVLVDKYITDENGCFVTKYYPCGDDWTISEISPSKGYLLDETVYEVGAEANKYTVELNAEKFTLKETVIKGSISIIKHCDDGSTQIETPEVGAEFQIFLSSAIAYDNAKETERDILICDEHGYAKTKDLPFGIYTVKQTKGWDGRDLMPEFTVVIDENGKVYRYLINNSVFESFVKIVKVDAETGNTIPYAGAGFKIYDPNGKLVTMTLTYPEVATIDTFYTSEEGYLITPESLEYGEGYYLIEVQAPVGYVLDTTPVYFDITEANSTLEDAVTVIKVTQENTAQKGIIKITKSGEVFSSVIEKDGMYQPLYSISGLAGAVYEITAAEDIITLDGTVRYTKGEVVATLTTDENGYAESQPLYLGKFIVREITAPFGMVLNTEPVNVELTYAGQEIEITDTSASFVNERQKISIDLIKSMEKDELFGIGNNDEVLSVQFALYAAKDIIAADGTMIPKGALIEIASCDIDGKLTFNTDMPVGSVVIIREYATDEHYLLFEGEFLVIFDYAGQDEKIVHVTLNDCADITNEIIRGTVIGKKVDEDGFTVAGALFGLFNPDETVFTEETALMLSESNEIGIFGFENVPYGNWIIRELRPAPAFVLNEELYEVNIAEDEQFIEITIENKFITGSVTTTKVDKEYPDNKLTGAIFEIYVDIDGNGEFDANIDTLLGEMTETETGVYLYEQLRYGGYFLYEKSAPEGFVKDDGYYYFEIRTNGETVTVENEAGVGFVNKSIKGNVTTTKVDKEYPDNKLTGAIFEIYVDVDGNGEFDADIDTLLGEMSETETGVYLYEQLRYGGYFLYEKTAPEGFVKDDGYYYFEIRTNGETETVENEAGIGFVNEPIPEPDIPQTGDTSNLGFWLGLAAIALGGIIATAIIVIKGKKDDE